MRLIDADLLSEDAFEVQTQEYGNIEVVGLDAIDSMVTIDAEPVVHCGDCKHRIFVEVGDVGQIGGCEIFGCAMQNSSFCSYGERKENT